MKKSFIFLVLFSAFTNLSFAGGILTNTNQSVHFLRNPARDASTDIDAVYSNPAGLTFMTDGFRISFTNQSVFQTRTITSTFAPFAMNNEGNSTKVYKGKTTSPIVPSIQLAYKKGNFVLSGHFAIVGGGGKVTFKQGLPSFEAPVSMIPLALTSNGLTTTAYSMDCVMEGSSYIFGVQVNGSYKFSDAFSAALGLRINIVNNGYKGHLTNIQINPLHPLLNPTGGMMPANTFFTNAGMTAYAASTADKQIDCKQSGLGYSPVLSVNYHTRGLIISAKYEFRSAIDVKNKTKVDDTGMFPDGKKTANDIPAILSMGISYEISDKWIVSGGYHHYFDSDADMANDKQKNIHGGINEALFGTEYQLNKLLLVSAGAQYTKTGVKDAYQSDLSYSLNSYTFGFGGALNITQDLRVNLGYFFTLYNDWHKTSTSYNGSSLAGEDVYGRTNNVIGIGFDYKF